MENSPSRLVEYIRDGLVEQEHYGFIIHACGEGIIKSYGETFGYPYFLRSCAKPLQASLIFDYGMDKEFCMTEQEIALCTASHAGEKCHTEIIDNLLKKFGLDETDLKCGIHKPLSKTRQNEMLLSGEKETQIHNNCSGKHTMMLGLCKLNNWDLKTYDDINHPLQQAVKKKIYELCEIEEEYPITKDGCGVPIMSMPLENMLKGFLNLFSDDKYSKLKSAFLNNPYLIGGEDRTDTKIIENSQNILAKVGAGGLCIVINTKINEGFIVKINDCNMQAREFAVVEFLKKLGWADINIDKNIKTLHNEKVGFVRVNL